MPLAFGAFFAEREFCGLVRERFQFGVDNRYVSWNHPVIGSSGKPCISPSGSSFNNYFGGGGAIFSFIQTCFRLFESLVLLALFK
jgi:hypothetical protein